MDIDLVYEILISWGKKGTYANLSLDYASKGGEWLPPYAWGETLSQLNKLLAEVNAPPLSALVISRHTGIPRCDFWACAPNVPPRHNNPLKRNVLWESIIEDINSYQWPSKLPKS